MNTIPARGQGTVRVVAAIGRKKTHTLVFKNVLYVPSYAANLLSTNLITKVAEVVFFQGGAIARKNGQVIFRGTVRQDGLTFLN